MKYLALIYGSEAQGSQATPEEFSAELDAYKSYEVWLKEQGATWSGEALQPTDTATTLRTENGKVVALDGPFAETKEQLGGYYVFECDNLDRALELAKRIPGVNGGSVEVRPVMELDF